MKSQRTNSTFASSNTPADASACKKAIFCFPRGAKNKRTAPIKKQPFQLTNFSPFSTMTAWTRWQCIRIIIKSDYFTTFYAFVATFTRFFSSCVHKLDFKKLITRLIPKIGINTFLATLLSRTNFHLFSDCSSWSPCSFSGRNKLSRSSIPNSCGRFTHFKSIYRLIQRFQHKGLKAYPILICYLFDDLPEFLKAVNYSSGQFHLSTVVCYGQFPTPFQNFFRTMVCKLYYLAYPFCTSRDFSLESFVLYSRPRLSFVDMT